MKGANEIQTIKIDNCIIHICDNAIETEEKQKEIWKEFSRIACKLLMEEGETNEN